jgi:hypothetical protein
VVPARRRAHGLLWLSWLLLLVGGCGGSSTAVAPQHSASTPPAASEPAPSASARPRNPSDILQPGWATPQSQSGAPQPGSTGPAAAAVPIAPGRFTATPSLTPIPVDVTPGEPLAEAFQRVRQAYDAASHETFDPRRAYATSPARDFAWYFTVNDPDDAWGRTQHVYFVATAPWDEMHTRAFLLSYLVMPAAPANETGRMWFDFYSAERPPFAVRYIFSNTPEGALEASMLSELGVTRWTPEAMPDIAGQAADLVAALGLEPRQSLDETCSPALDDLYRRLPHPGDDEDDDVFGRRYLPEGTLAAIGAVMGEAMRRSLPDALAWEADDDPVYPRLHARGAVEGILRPIPMLIEFYLSGTNVLPSDYCSQMLARVRGDAPGPGGGGG